MDDQNWLLGLGLAVAMAVPGVANAALVDRSGGLIYDSTLNITWLQDANYAKTSGYDSDGRMTWTVAHTWASNLVYGGYDDWRLPTMVDTGTPGEQCTNSGTDCGYNVQTTSGSTVYSEMASLFYDTLGNYGRYDSTGTATGCSPTAPYCLTNTSFFTNVQSYSYWSGLGYVVDPRDAWNFSFGYGLQSAFYKGSVLFAWAVRPGDVAPVPVPAAVWLFGSAMAGLVGLRRRARGAIVSCCPGEKPRAFDTQQV